jgi:hypothetical protein
MNPERPAQRANQPRVRYQPRRLRRTCAILASRFRSIGTFSAKLACIEPIGQGGPASREDRVAHRGARALAWHAPRARRRGQRSNPKNGHDVEHLR